MFFVKINIRIFVLLCKTYNETLQQVFAYVLISHTCLVMDHFDIKLVLPTSQ